MCVCVRAPDIDFNGYFSRALISWSSYSRRRHSWETPGRCSSARRPEYSHLSLFEIFYMCLFLAVLCWLLCTGFLQLGYAGATVHCGAWTPHCGGFSLSSLQALSKDSAVVAHRLRCSIACGIFPDQGRSPCPLQQQAESYPLCQQGTPQFSLF